MAYTSLYRKYRPDSFDKVIGQEHIVRTLKNQIASGQVGHAYIFTGTRGTGKTSVAKIFARAVNCLSPSDGSPCGKCDNCKQLAESGNFDILELDAASNNSVDQIREITDKIAFPPTVGKYKVYIIDEVHMLSTAAFNALLKTLEEPPSHAIFILATTEIHKIPATILSRCLRFDFRLVPAKIIAQRIKEIFDDIGVRYEDGAAELIAGAGAGSVRDALSVADMCVSYCDGKVTYNGVLEVLGASDPGRIKELAKDILEGNVDGALKKVAELIELGKSVNILAKDIAEFMRNVLYVKYCSGSKELLSLPEGVYSGVKEIADSVNIAKCLNVLGIMSRLEGELRYSSQHRIIFEGALVEACLDSGAGKDDINQRLLRLEKAYASLRRSNFNGAPAIMDARQVWVKVASELRNRGYTLIAISLRDAGVEMTDSEFTVLVYESATMQLVSEKRNRDVIRECFESVEESKGRTLVIKEAFKLDEDKALPYIKEMFGDLLEIR